MIEEYCKSNIGGVIDSRTVFSIILQHYISVLFMVCLFCIRFCNEVPSLVASILLYSIAYCILHIAYRTVPVLVFYCYRTMQE